MPIITETTPKPAAPPPRTFSLEGLTVDQLEAIHSLLGQVTPSHVGVLGNDPWINTMYKEIRRRICTDSVHIFIIIKVEGNVSTILPIPQS